MISSSSAAVHPIQSILLGIRIWYFILDDVVGAALAVLVDADRLVRASLESIFASDSRGSRG